MAQDRPSAATDPHYRDDPGWGYGPGWTHPEVAAVAQRIREHVRVTGQRVWMRRELAVALAEPVKLTGVALWLMKDMTGEAPEPGKGRPWVVTPRETPASAYGAPMTTPTPTDDALWTDDELRASALAYADLLGQQRAGQTINRAAAVAGLRAGPLAARSDRSVHERFSNISTVLRRRHLPSLTGATRENVGRLVAERLWQTLKDHPVIIECLGEPIADDGELRARADDLLDAGPLSEPTGQQAPGTTTATEQRFKRDPKVQAWVRSNAAGVCEACQQPAPFSDKKGRPFLEVHHVLPLGQGGSDRTSNAAALCPNCHRRCHLAADAEAYLDALYANVGRLVREAPTVDAAPEQHLPD